MVFVGLGVVYSNLLSHSLNICFGSFSLQPSVTHYNFVFPKVPPIQDSVGVYRFHVCCVCYCVCTRVLLCVCGV